MNSKVKRPNFRNLGCDKSESFNSVNTVSTLYMHTWYAGNNDHPSMWNLEKGEERIRYSYMTNGVDLQNFLNGLCIHPFHKADFCNASIVDYSPQRYNEKSY